MFTEDLSIFLADFGSPVVANGVNGLGIYDAPGKYIGENDRISVEHVVMCLSSQFGNLLYEQPITVNGLSFKVRENRPLGDGSFCKILLTRLDVILSVYVPGVFEEGVFL